jgi:hypothetical protein
MHTSFAVTRVVVCRHDKVCGPMVDTSTPHTISTVGSNKEVSHLVSSGGALYIMFENHVRS